MRCAATFDSVKCGVEHWYVVIGCGMLCNGGVMWNGVCGMV